MAEIIIIADDLTGAADSAAACAAHGPTAIVTLGLPQDCTTLPDSDILSIDANTRCLSAGQAAGITSQIVRARHDHRALRPGSLIFKKLDSTLRGHFAAELAAVLRELNAIAPAGEEHCIVMAPALPAQGRITIGGRQIVDGRQLHEGDIPAQLGAAGLSCRIIDIATVRADARSLEQLMVMLSHQTDVLLCDAESDDDLRRIAEATMVLGDRAVWAGSAGLAAHLHRAGRLSSTTGQPQQVAATSRRPTLFVVGSVSSVSREQAALLSALPDVTTFRLTMASVLSSTVNVAPVLTALQSRRDVLVALDDNERCSESESTLLTKNVARMLGPCAALPGAVVATGGETARALLDELGIRRLRIVDEVEPGIPFSMAEGWTRPLPIITKAGGFGSSGALIRCREFLSAPGHSPARIRAGRTSVS
ncbi:four-carbon acid sugar kinase family protein [Occallatibacter riparius]|uniref:Four-carbon acid sugar kinase family protein n=1 Tax=Occallatibacter riparius TaxID=1002689 RepID=A0A9J7BFY3_9BACT|nr:four-carbon acid sugar kinase family protein [Occallatibacter riparius]UWZ81671.1 four-carbon acid sugar kinase family protein [Occallatibacter riparius]